MQTAPLDSPVFSLEAGSLNVSAGSYQTIVDFSAPSTLHVDAGIETSVTLQLFDGKDRFIGGVRDERERTLIGKRATWRHEVDDAKFKLAKRYAYQIEHSMTYRKKFVGGEIPELPVEADGAELFPWFAPPAASLEDRIVKVGMSFWATERYFQVHYQQACKLDTSDCRTEFELYLLDDKQEVVFGQRFSSRLEFGHPSWDDASVRMERKELRALKFYEIYGTTEVRGLVSLKVS